MKSWATQMPQGFHLKSDGNASNLSDPDKSLTLGQYCAEKGIRYADQGYPVPRDVFVAYGEEFQRRLVPNLDRTDIVSVRQIPGGFELQSAAGETLQAKQVVIAAGISHFGHVPPLLSDVPPEYLSHSLKINEIGDFEGRKIAVIGAGASAIDVAALLHESGADVVVIARRHYIAYHPPHNPNPSLWERLTHPISPLGGGWKSVLATIGPLAFYRLPRNLRFRAVKRHLGPAPGWFMRERVEGKIARYLGTQLKGVRVEDGHAIVDFIAQDGTDTSLKVDHVIAATGFKTDIARLKFLSPEIRASIKTDEEAPVLSNFFESSVPGLYFVGLASAYHFGPLTRFSHGNAFTAKRLTRHLAG
jgi:thioredoxin reductase